MKKVICLLAFMLLSLNEIISQENKFYVKIDTKFISLYKFKKEINEEKKIYFSSMRIQKNQKKKSIKNKIDFLKRNNKDEVIVKAQPAIKDYYEFETYNKPKVVKKLDFHKFFSIEDISKNVKELRKVWIDYKYSIVFIEKNNHGYVLWEMRPIYHE